MSISAQFQKLDISSKSWRELFNKIGMDSDTLMKKNKLSMKVAFSRDNAEKNRYTNVLPYDQNRVTLKNPNAEGGHYINASPVYAEKAFRKYILSQGPVVESLSDFWQMIFENDVPAIIMLNKLYEGSYLKCEKYYPTEKEPSLVFGEYTIDLVSETKKENFVVREMTLKNGADEKDITQIQYTEWPDFGVPESPGHFLEMLDYIKDLNVLSSSDDEPPVVIHCSAGIGRSGTFVLVDSVLRMIELGIPESDIEVNDLLVQLRSQRMGLIQTPEQLRFAWAAIVDGLPKLKITGNIVPPVNGDTAAGIRKRKSESQEEFNDRIAKRRELISKMVAKSRQCEEKLHHHHDASSFISKSVLVGGAVAVATLAMYMYYFRR